MAHKGLIPTAERLGLSRSEAAELIGFSPTTFDLMIGQGVMPRPKRFGRRTVWDRRAIERAFAELPDDTLPAGEISPFMDVAA